MASTAKATLSKPTGASATGGGGGGGSSSRSVAPSSVSRGASGTRQQQQQQQQHLSAGDGASPHPGGSSTGSSKRSRTQAGQIIRWESALQGGADADETLRGRDRSRRSFFRRMIDMDLKKSDGRLRQKVYILILTAIPFLLMMIRNAYMLSYNTGRIDSLASNFNIMVNKMQYVKILLDVVLARAEVFMFVADANSATANGNGYKTIDDIVNATTMALQKAQEITGQPAQEDKIRKQLTTRDQLSMTTLTTLFQTVVIRLTDVLKDIDTSQFDQDAQAVYLLNLHFFGQMFDSYAWLYSTVGVVYATGNISNTDRLAALRYQQIGDFYNQRFFLTKTKAYEDMMSRITNSEDYATVQRLVGLTEVDRNHFQEWAYAMRTYIDALFQATLSGVTNTSRDSVIIEKASIQKTTARDEALLILSCVMGAAIVLIFFGLYTNMNMQALRVIETIAQQRRERQRLLVCLPPTIQKRVLSGDIPGAAKFKEVSMVMGTIASFDRVVAEMDPAEFCKMVEDLHRLTDDVAKKYGLYIQQGLGHSFVALAGVPDKNENHASRAVNFCFNLKDKAAKLYPRIQLKFGAYAGPAIGLIGKGLQLPRYFAFTEGSVLVSYLLQIAAGGDVLLSQKLYERLQQEENINFAYSEVGNVNVQRCGQQKCYRVTRSS